MTQSPPFFDPFRDPISIFTDEQREMGCSSESTHTRPKMVGGHFLGFGGQTNRFMDSVGGKEERKRPTCTHRHSVLMILWHTFAEIATFFKKNVLSIILNLKRPTFLHVCICTEHNLNNLNKIPIYHMLKKVHWIRFIFVLLLLFYRYVWCQTWPGTHTSFCNQWQNVWNSPSLAIFILPTWNCLHQHQTRNMYVACWWWDPRS